jgi:hypothetical protein
MNPFISMAMVRGRLERPRCRPRLLALLGSWVLLLSAQAARAEDLPVDQLVSRTLQAYGGKEALGRAGALQLSGRVSSTMRKGATGTITIAYSRPDRLRVEIRFPDEPPEIRIVDGAKGWRGGKEAAGPLYDSMVLQAARFALPLSLEEHRAELHDLGAVDLDQKKLRRLELPLPGKGSVLVDVEPESGRILRTVGKMAAADGTSLEFVNVFDDFRTVDGLLFAYREDHVAMGKSTGVTTFESVRVVASLPSETFRP